MATLNSTTKVCTKCGVEYPATTEYFYKYRGGLYPSCKTCQHAYSARYRAEHVEEERTRHARHYAEKPEEIRAKHASYRAKNKDERRARDARYAAEHKDEIRAYQARWRAEKPEAVKAINHRRKARECQLPNDFTAQEWQRCLEYWGHKCAYCGKTEDMWTVIVPDHYIAIKDPCPDNPGTVATNIIPACHARKGVPAGTPCCNQSKGNKDPKQWIEQRFGKRKAREIIKRIQDYFVLVKAQ